MESQKYRQCLVYYIFAVLSFVFFYSSASLAGYPLNGWPSASPEAQGMQSDTLADMMAYIHKKQYQIDSITIVRNGQIVLDAYFWPYMKNQPHDIASCTKSITSALMGIAIDKGFISNIDRPVLYFFKDKTIANMNSHKQSMTIENLLTMASGMECRDTYRHQFEGFYEMKNSGDWVQYVLDLPMSGPPGETFEYCSGASLLLSAIIRTAAKMSTLDFAKKYLFTPLDIVDVDWEVSPKGNHTGYGDMSLTPRDMSKIGWLYLNKGRWGNKQLISPAWVETSTRGHFEADLFDHYGYQWWGDSAGWWFNSVDYYMAVGYEGQRIFIVPEKKLVAVFTGRLQGKDNFIPDKLLRSYILPAVSSRAALPQNKKGTVCLDKLVNKAAKPFDYIWTFKDEGMAKDRIFIRTASPAFQFEYPAGSYKAETDAPGQIMRMKGPGHMAVRASIIKVPNGIPIQEFGPKFYLQNLKKHGTSVEVTSNKEIILKCGTKAYRTDIKWLWNRNVSMRTLLVSVYKDGKAVFLNTVSWNNSHKKCEPIIQSLTFGQDISGCRPEKSKKTAGYL